MRPGAAARGFGHGWRRAPKRAYIRVYSARSPAYSDGGEFRIDDKQRAVPAARADAAGETGIARG